MAFRVLVVVLAACLASTAAQAKPLKIGPNSEDGAILIEVEPASPPLKPNAAYTLTIGSYAAETKSFRTSSFGGWANMDGLGHKQTGRTFAARKMKPGTYAIQSVNVGNWGACFNGGTVHFDVGPGEVVYLGRLDPTVSINEIQDAVRSGKIPGYASANRLIYVFDTSRPALAGPDKTPGWEEAAKAYLAANHPETTAPLRAATLVETSFGTGRDLFGISKLCGGYYAKKDKPAAAD